VLAVNERVRKHGHQLGQVLHRLAVAEKQTRVNSGSVQFYNRYRINLDVQRLKWVLSQGHFVLVWMLGNPQLELDWLIAKPPRNRT
jgi:hypothetical protein